MVGLISLEEVAADPNCAHIQHIYYKEGRFGRVFSFYAGEWIPSSKPVSEVRKAIAAAKNGVVVPDDELPPVPLVDEPVEPALKKPRKQRATRAEANDLASKAERALLASDVVMTRPEIAAKCGVDSQSLSATLRKLIAQGRVARGPRRKVVGVQVPLQTFKAVRRKRVAA